MKKLFLVVFRDEVIKTFMTYNAAINYIYMNGNDDYSIQEVNYE